MKYLLDTNIIIFWLKNRYNIPDKIKEVGIKNCYISVVTVAELQFGVECSDPMYLDEKRKRLSDLLLHLQIIPISAAVDIYALEKARLRRDGELISDFDLLIGATAIQQDMIMVTNNTKHLSKIDGINITDWTDR